MPEPEAAAELSESPYDDAVPPLDVDGVRTVATGTVLFLLAGLALLPFRDDLAADGRGWWLWVCVTGVGLGLFGTWYCRRRAARPPRESALEDRGSGPAA